jgi:hypothetical protein
MKKQSEIYRDHDPYSRMILQELNQLRDQKEIYKAQIMTQVEEIENLEDRIERMKGVLYFTFALSTLAIILILENILHPFLRTL